MGDLIDLVLFERLFLFLFEWVGCKWLFNIGGKEYK